jgi:hydrogenase maturation protease
MAETSTKTPILVLGIGNILLRDEGVGVHTVRAMASTPLPDGVELLDGGTAGADLLDSISDRDTLIVVDTLDADVPSGTILRLQPQDLADSSSESISLHEFGIAETLRMASQLNCGPRHVAIIAIKPKDIRCGLELSPQMKQWMPRIIDAVHHEIEGRMDNHVSQGPTLPASPISSGVSHTHVL